MGFASLMFTVVSTACHVAFRTVALKITAMRGRFEVAPVASVSAFIAWSLLTVLTALALVRPSFHYDAWWYHLPFSALVDNT